jgi:RimJ/RimL family protein N-acetyltransferase
VTRLVLAWAFDVLGLNRIQLEVLATNRRAINCYLACGLRTEGIRREAELYPDGFKDFILMGLLRSEYAAGDGLSGGGPGTHVRQTAASVEAEPR